MKRIVLRNILLYSIIASLLGTSAFGGSCLDHFETIPSDSNISENHAICNRLYEFREKNENQGPCTLLFSLKNNFEDKVLIEDESCFAKCLFINLELTKELAEVSEASGEVSDKNKICQTVGWRAEKELGSSKTFENLNRMTSKLFSGGVFEELFKKKIVSRRLVTKAVRLLNSVNSGESLKYIENLIKMTDFSVKKKKFTDELTRPLYKQAEAPKEKVRKHSEESFPEFLRIHGLESLEEKFNKHGVSHLSIFKLLHDEYLKEIGLNIGDRIKVLRVIKHVEQEDQDRIISPGPEDLKRSHSSFGSFEVPDIALSINSYLGKIITGLSSEEEAEVSMKEELEEVKKLRTWQDQKHDEEIKEMFARSQKELNDLDKSIRKSVKDIKRKTREMERDLYKDDL